MSRMLVYSRAARHLARPTRAAPGFSRLPHDCLPRQRNRPRRLSIGDPPTRGLEPPALSPRQEPWNATSLGPFQDAPCPGATRFMNYEAYFADALARLRDERRYRVFADLERLAGRFPRAIWHSPRGPRDVIVWCSNDYLGMGQHPKVIGTMVETATRMGTGA